MRRASPFVAVLVAALACAASGGARPSGESQVSPSVRTWVIHYRAHNGVRRVAHVVLPASYGPGNAPPIPLVISPHGRGLTGRHNVPIWGTLPAEGPFAVVSPDGHGRRLPRYSWGYRGQIDDLARMPDILRRTLPWLRIDRTRVYAFGGSMGGQEVLLLAARYPELLAGAAAFDAVTNLARQYRAFPRLPCHRRCRALWKGPLGLTLQRLARHEIGGTPATVSAAYAARSPIAYVRSLAFSCVPIQMWWSVADRVVVDQQHQSARLFWNIRGLNPIAPVQAFVGFWIHTSEMRAQSQLPRALATFGLLPSAPVGRGTVRSIPAESSAANCTPAGPDGDSP
jgi:pimeloyl-ACP methyl ester carboxylesterase